MKNLFNILDNSSSKPNDFTTLQNARLDLIGELEAIVQYENHLMQTNDMAAKSTNKDIVKEEKVHVGQLFGLIFSLDPESKEMFEKGIVEFNTTNR
ncbi:MAG: ubiquinone biosynthesis protein COQ7 [Clostridia bacterium]|nr:ubiquinone biosynthesis protein COQ7 [Clostridia bacterium]